MRDSESRPRTLLLTVGSALVLILLGVASPARATLVTNGSFEIGGFVNTAANYMELDPGDTELTGWTVVETVVWGINPTDGHTASDGAGFVDLSGFGSTSPNGELQQLLSTVPGKQYLFSIDRRGNSTVKIDGGALVLIAGGTSGPWTTYSALFAATSTTSLLSISHASAGSIVFIDKISLVAVSEPGTLTLSLFAAGLLRLRFMQRRKR